MEEGSNLTGRVWVRVTWVKLLHAVLTVKMCLLPSAPPDEDYQGKGGFFNWLTVLTLSTWLR